MLLTPEGQKIIFTGPSRRGFHRLSLVARCPQLFAWQYRAPSRPTGPPSPPLARGTLIHLALAQHYRKLKAIQQGEDPLDWADAFTAIDQVAALEGTQKHAQLCKEAYLAYVRAHPPEEELAEMRILMVEDVVETTIAGKYLLTGRLDLAYEDLAGRVWVMDHKTSVRITKKHRVFYGIHGQLHAYRHMAAERYGKRLAGLKVNMVQHGADPKFERFDLPRAPNLESRFERIIVDLEQLVERLDAEGRSYDDWPKAFNELTCYHRYGPCDHLTQCMKGAGAAAFGDFEITSAFEVR